ncbi:hypothetical protein L7F22_028714 [Adiantum nelumboides]|nr:hypothetical protein [Adiantum nelumboides]
MLALYVDDMVLTNNNEDEIAAFKDALRKTFEMSDLGLLHCYLGIGLNALAEQEAKDGLFHTTCGTPNYVSLEVIVHNRYDGAKANIWSCGVILFVFMAKYLFFDDSSLMHLYQKIHRAKPKFPP